MSINNSFYEKDEIRKLFKIVFIIWVLCALYLGVSQWEAVLNLQFNDNDDFMRFHQYRSWLQQGNWYLTPIPAFSPNNQLIMHWSRLVDIPLAFFAYVFALFFDLPIAFALTHTVVPLLYLLLFLSVVALLSHRLFGMETAKIAMLLPLASPLSMRFLPGALDHHNLQFILLALFIFFSPLVRENVQFRHSLLSALCLVLSLWIGLENIYTFAVILFLLTLWGYFFRSVYLVFCQSVSGIVVCLVPLFLVFNRPIEEFLQAHYDVLSFPFWLCFVSAWFFCIGLKSVSPTAISLKIAFYLGWGVTVLLPVVWAYPELLKGGYADYPDLLKRLWLNNVSEAVSLVQHIAADPKHVGYVLAVLMALVSPYYFPKQGVQYRILYVAFLINLLLAFFWQIRMFSVALVCGIPLQAYVCARLREASRHAFVKSGWLFLAFPSLVLFLVAVLFNLQGKQIETESGETFSVIALLNKHQINGKNTLASIDLGAPILVGTNNHIISAPYHRNIEGNLDAFHFFLAKDEAKAQAILNKYQIDYVLLDNNFYQHIFHADLKQSMLHKVFENKNLPDYLEYVDTNGFITLYRYVGGEK